MSRVSFRNLKSSAVAMVAVPDRIPSFLKWSVAPIAALAAMAFVSSVTPASAGEYCRKDVTSQVVSCSFASLEQCQWTSAGRGGDCFRDPWLSAADKHASALNANAQVRTHRVAR